jgi:hypothetical protein
VQGVGKVADRPAARPEEANTWSCTELFPSPCARQEQRSSARFGFLAGRGAQEIAFAVVSSKRRVLREGEETVTKHGDPTGIHDLTISPSGLGGWPVVTRHETRDNF